VTVIAIMARHRMSRTGSGTEALTTNMAVERWSSGAVKRWSDGAHTHEKRADK
jgi:hypothetical protein